MLRFVTLLQSLCPLKPRYTSFFGNLKSYMNFINSASGSANYDSDLKGKAQGLYSSISALSGKGGASADSSKVMETLMSMGKTLGHQQESSPTMSLGERKELIMSMAKWTQTIGQFVVSPAAQNGKTIDISSLGLDIDASATATGESTTNTETSTTTDTGTPSGGNTATGTGSTAGGTTTTGTGTTAVGSPTSSCTTSKCSNGDGSSFKAAVNIQHGGKASSQSQQTTSAQQDVTSAGSS
ncbi:PREDICTED: putative per-hexamer repeat protein 5 [Camelina sativa]|uniref:Per-hexamer repeat protein 5 n=1 Tax=Camelina sativa TaxID=90675 RepID=A0ABM1RSS5_CAMSA|nr:PREDICTED: putative per-hexamer repeat protein 5 [Camelina sativa]